jgi:hypothetical protein
VCVCVLCVCVCVSYVLCVCVLYTRARGRWYTRVYSYHSLVAEFVIIFASQMTHMSPHQAALNAGRPNPIAQWAKTGSAALQYPWHHPMERWETTKKYFPHLGVLNRQVCSVCVCVFFCVLCACVCVCVRFVLYVCFALFALCVCVLCV